MIEFGKITGEVDNNLIQVKMRTGESLFAPLTVIGTDVSIPSKDWITANKDNFLALVTYEKDMYISPMIIGFYPVKGASSAKYNSFERLMDVVEKLIKQLSEAKVNTQLGPQQFLPDTLLVFEELSDVIGDIKRNINQIDL